MRGPKGRFERVILKGVLWVGIALLLAFAVLLAGSSWEVYQKEVGAKGELNAALVARDDLRDRKEKLAANLSALETERGLEAEFRERFPVAKEGEEVIILVEPKPEAPAPSEGVEKGFWSTVQGWFGW